MIIRCRYLAFDLVSGKPGFSTGLVGVPGGPLTNIKPQIAAGNTQK